jgi:hypothetical protein
MKTTRLSVALLAATALVAAACQTDLTGLNVNPNSPSLDTPPPPGTIFARATSSMMGRYGGAAYQLSGVELLAQHIAQTQYPDEDKYNYRVLTIDGYFTGPYTSELMDFQQVINVGKAQKDPNTWGPAAVLQVYSFQALTDMFGDVPYSEALQGTTGASLKPKYDAQKDIYYGMVKSLADATTAMGSGAGMGSLDPIYGGDAAKWKKLSNGLRLRLAMRMQKADLAKANTELAAAIAASGGLLSSNADNARIVWPGDQVFDNPWAANFATRDDHRMSKTLMDVLIANNDPRLPYIAQPVSGTTSTYAGQPNGLDVAAAGTYANKASRPGAMFYPGKTAYGTYGSTGRSAPSYMFTFAEQNFILAEAANRGMGGLNAGQAAAYYNAGVTASITQWGGSAADAAAYLAQPAIAYQGGAAGLTQILTQKWIAFFSQGEEAWSDWRRTGVPANIVAGPSAILNYVPRRMLYASSEQSVNKDKLLEAIARQGADLNSTRMWWDK